MDFEIDLQDFIDEAEDQIRILNDGLLSLEKDKNNEDIINEVFRAAHTLKGGSGLVGFTKIMELTHQLESIFDLIRDKKLALTSAHLDIMFEVLDVLMELMSEVNSGEFKTDIKKVSKKLQSILDNTGAEEPAEEQKSKKKSSEKKESVEADTSEPVKSSDMATVIEQTEINDNNSEEENAQLLIGRELSEAERQHIQLIMTQTEDSIYVAEISIMDTCAVISLFMFMVFNKVKEIGELIASNPTEDVLETEEADHVKILFASIVPVEDIQNELMMPEVENISIRKVATGGEFSFADVSVPQADNREPDEPGVPSKDKEPDSRDMEDGESDSEDKTDMVLSKKTSTTLRVDSTKIDTLLNLVGELVINKARFIQMENQFEKHFGKSEMIDHLKIAVMQLMRVTNEIQEGIMQLRMVPISQVFNKFPRVIRDLARKLDKKIDLEIIGKETELDKSVVEEIGDPLMHLVRNSVDHGIETTDIRIKKNKKEEGKITMRAFHEGSSIVIEIEDDGKGLDVEKIKTKAVEREVICPDDAANLSDKDAVNLIFMPGFSTADQVSNLSGRGVGMDVVKKNVERLNGVIEIVTEQDKGTLFTIKLPLTLAIISTLLVKIMDSIYAIPLINVVEIVEVDKKEISKVANKEAIRIRNDVINILRLDEVFHMASENRKKDKIQIVIVGMAEHRVGFAVDDLVGEQDVVIKSLDNSLVESQGIAGASILGDGTVALIVDVSALLERFLQEMH